MIALATLPSAGLRRLRWRIRLGSLLLVERIARDLCFVLCQPDNRRYIEQFLMKGPTHEVGDATYTERSGGERGFRRDVLHAESGNSRASILGDLASENGMTAAAFDCIVFTQVLPFNYDIPDTLADCRRALVLGGTPLVTKSGVSQISRHVMDSWGDFWRLADASVRRLFGDAFGEAQIQGESFCKVLAAIALMHDSAAAELSESEFMQPNRYYPLIIVLRARAGDRV